MSKVTKEQIEIFKTQMVDLVNKINVIDPISVSSLIEKEIYKLGYRIKEQGLKDNVVLSTSGIEPKVLYFNLAKKEFENDYDKLFIMMMAYYCAINGQTIMITPHEFKEIHDTVPNSFFQAGKTMDGMYHNDKKLIKNKKSIYMKVKKKQERINNGKNK